MERKTHYKMYKAGKNWVFAMLSTIALTGVMAMSGNTAKADTVAQSTTEQVAKVNTTSATTTSTQATTQVEKATNTTNESNAAQTSATTTTEQSSSNADATSSNQNNKQATTTSVATSQNTSVANKDQASSTQSSTTQKNEEPKVETPVNTADNASQKYINGNWYLIDNSTGKNLTGFQKIENQGKTVYYNEKGQMQHGQQVVNNQWYLFDKYTGAMQTGFQNLTSYGQNKVVYYNEKGQMQHGLTKVNQKTYYLDEVSGEVRKGQQVVGNHWYLFDKSSGVMQTGFQNLAPYGQNKVVYYASNGQMQFGQQVVGNYWYLFDKVTGAMQTGFQNLASYGQNKVVYYAPNGQMQHGQKYIDKHWYLFDKVTGAMQTGFQNLAPYGQNKVAYYASNGQMQFGQKYINKHWYLFDKATGKMAIGFTNIPDQNKTVYYSEDKSKLGQMEFGWQDINSGRYYLDKVTGAVQKGQKYINGHWYNFDKVTGKMSVGFAHLTDSNKVVYYSEDKTKLGQMLYGFQTISGKTYYFDKVQGTVATGEKNINNHWYLFDNKGVMQVGFHDLDGGKRTVYYSEAKSNYGQMLYGNQVINGKNYYFDTTTGAMRKGTLVFDKTNHTLSYVTSEGLVAKNMKYKINNVEYVFNIAGVLEHLQGEANIAGNWYLFDNNNHVIIGFQTLKDGRKVYYSPNNAQMQYGQQNIDGHWYLFDKVNGSMQTGFKDLTPYGQNKTVYYASNGQMQYGKQNIDGHWYLFNTFDGAMYKGWLMSGNDWYYYNQQNGQLQTGSAVINGVGYNFDGNGKQILNYSIDYRYALPTGKGDDETAANNYIILHDVGVESGAAANARYFHDTVDTNEAYVTFVVGDGGKVYQVGRPGQVSWGAGRVANHNAPVQIELGRTYNSGQFWQDYVTYVRLARDMAGKYGIPLTLDAGGAGTRGIKSHYWVTKNIWGDHVDPYGYLSRFGVTQAKLAHDLLYGV